MPLMRPDGVVMRLVSGQDRAQMPAAEDHHPVQYLSAQGADEALPYGGRRDRHAGFRQFAVDPVPLQRILRQADDKPGDARDRRRAAGLASLARVIRLRGQPVGQPAMPDQKRRRCHREDFGPAPAGYQPGQRGEPDPGGRLVTYPAGAAVQHRVLVPESQQFGIFRQVRAGYQDG